MNQFIEEQSNLSEVSRQGAMPSVRPRLGQSLAAPPLSWALDVVRFPPTYLDKDATFHWLFQVHGPPEKKVPDHAILTGEDTAAGGYGVPNVLYELQEAAEGERDWMLNLSQAQEVVVWCITEWLRDSWAHGMSRDSLP